MGKHAKRHGARNAALAVAASVTLGLGSIAVIGQAEATEKTVNLQTPSGEGNAVITTEAKTVGEALEQRDAGRDQGEHDRVLHPPHRRRSRHSLARSWTIGAASGVVVYAGQ